MPDATPTATTPRDRSGGLGLFTPDFFQDPYPVYRKLRDHPEPLVPLRDGLFIAPRYEQCHEITRDPARFGRDASRRRGPAARLIGRRGVIGTIVKGALPFVDGEEHQRIRLLVHRVLDRRIEAMGEPIQQMTDALIDSVAPTGQMEVLADLAIPLPAMMVGELLGIPSEDRERFDDWAVASHLTQLTEPVNDLRATTAAGRGARAAHAYFIELIEARRRDPGDDAISELVQAESRDGDRLSTDEIAANCNLLLNNFQTISVLIGTGLLALLRHRDQLERFRSDASVRGAAIQELLRFETPAPFLNRIIMHDMEFAGRELQQGNTIVLAIGSANRDGRRFPRPDELDFDRPDSHHHLAFGGGPHYCLGGGNSLTQVAVQIALGALLERCADLGLAESPRFRQMITLRRLEALHVAFETSA